MQVNKCGSSYAKTITCKVKYAPKVYLLGNLFRKKENCTKMLRKIRRDIVTL